MSPDRHFEGARLLGANLTGKERREDAGNILGDVLRGIMQTMKIPNGIRFRKESCYFEFFISNSFVPSSLGYGSEDIPELVKGALPQERVNKLAPRQKKIS